jgi:hypothetical protein
MADVANAIAAVIPADDSKLRPGDVLLLEAQTHLNEPVEVDSQVYQYIYNATVRGIVVVEAAGNAGLDLDTYTYQALSLLNRGSSQFRESGAIMVGAAHRSPHNRMPTSNHGNRIDCYAWGESVYSTSGTGGYGALSDTSAAAAIIAGAALSIQGIAQQFNKGVDLPNHRYLPDQLRSILRNPATGTVSANSNWNSTYDSTWDPLLNPNFLTWNQDGIGVMPDLGAIINQTLGLWHNHIHPPLEVERVGPIFDPGDL